MTLGSFIRQRLAELGMQQTALALDADVHATTMSGIVNDKRKSFPDPDVLRRVAEVLQVSPADLLIAAGYLDPDDATRFREMHETAVVHDVARGLEEAERQIATARRRLRELQDERGVVVTDGRG